MQIFAVQGEPHECGYLHDRPATLNYLLTFEASDDWYQHQLERGWRRFGPRFFRPNCSGCSECRGIRIRVKDFKPNRSQKRNLRQNEEIQVTVQRPTHSEEVVRLHNRYHEFMSELKSWPDHELSDRHYDSSFVQAANSFGYEFLYHLGDRLVGVALVDILPNSLSSVYFFHDPEFRDRGLGVFSVLKQLEYAAKLEIPYQYLGFSVRECPSMAYKTQYRPYELLQGYPEPWEEPVWIQPDA